MTCPRDTSNSSGFRHMCGISFWKERQLELWPSGPGRCKTENDTREHQGRKRASQEHSASLPGEVQPPACQRTPA